MTNIEIFNLTQHTINIVDFHIAYIARAEGRIISDLLITGEPAYGEDGSFIGYRSLNFFE